MHHPPQCASSRSLSFFRVLQPGFINRLRLPTKFVTNVLATKEIKVESASLVNPIGASWNVEVYKSVDQELYIGGLGWSDLAHAHNLGLGYFLVFRYRGDMAFDFRAFDLSTCEISYPSISQRVVSKKLKQRVPVLIRVKEEDKRSNFSPAESRVSCIRNKEKELMKSNAIRGVRFEVELTSYQLSKGHVTIPRRFKELSGLWEQGEVSLKDPKDRLWTVRLGHKRGRLAKTEQCTMGKGWLKFARGNKLEVGDRCIFELVSQGKGKENVMRVKLLRKNEA